MWDRKGAKAEHNDSVNCQPKKHFRASKYAAGTYDGHAAFLDAQKCLLKASQDLNSEVIMTNN